MAKCPRCKEDMPLLSNVCSCCGYVAESGGEGDPMSAKEFANVLEDSLHGLKNLKQPSFGSAFANLLYITMPLLAGALLAFAVIGDSGLFWLLFAVALILSLVFIIRKARGRLGSGPEDKKFTEIKAGFETFRRRAMTSYGADQEVKKLVNNITAEIEDIESKRKAASRSTTIVWVIILVATCALLSWSGVFVNKKVNSEEAQAEYAARQFEDQLRNMPVGERITALISKGEYRRAVDEYAGASNVTDLEGVALRAQIIKALLDAGEAALAEEFFFGNAMGKMKDIDNAEAIVNYHLGQGDREAARSFADQCTEMRYTSDRNKLGRMVK